MKILNIILDPRVGGPQIRIAEIGKQLKKLDIDAVTLFPENCSKGFKVLLDQENLSYISTSLHKISRNPWALFKWLFLFIPETFKLKRIIRRQNPVIVHCTGSWQWKGIIAAKLAGKRVVWHLNDTQMPWFIRIVFKRLVHFADAVIVVGARVKKYYLDSFAIKKPVYEIQAAVDTEKFDPLRRIVADEKIVSSKKSFAIVTVANLNVLKGLEYFIDAAKEINKTRDDVMFYVVGEVFATQQKYATGIRRKIEDNKLQNVILYGRSYDIPATLKAADIYVCASIFEASPKSVWEAMAMEKAIVSTDVGSVSDFIEDGVNGFVVEAGDVAAMVEKIDVLIGDRQLRQQMGRKAGDTAKQELNSRDAAKMHQTVYESLLKGVN